MKALLDEQLSPQNAVLLRQRGYDIEAAADRSDLIGCTDRLLLEIAASEGRAVVTNNIKDFRPLAAERLARGTSHAGLILLPASRIRSRSTIGALSDSIEEVLVLHPNGLDSSECWIGPVTVR